MFVIYTFQELFFLQNLYTRTRFVKFFKCVYLYLANIFVEMFIYVYPANIYIKMNLTVQH
jgi:hypothetical protein